MGSLFGGSSKPTTTTTTQSNEPWAGVRPYLSGAEGVPGVFNEAQRLYQSQGYSPEQQYNNAQRVGQLQGRNANPIYGDIAGGASDIIRGAFDPRINAQTGITAGQSTGNYNTPTNVQAQQVNSLGFPGSTTASLVNGNYSAPTDLQARQLAGNFNTQGQVQAQQTPNYGSSVGNISAQNVDLNAARSGQGALDPTNALRGYLSGTPTNPYLDQQAGSIVNQLTRNTQENVLPGIRSGAQAAGQYGGSRQGIAEGLAASRLNQDLAPALSGLYGGAYESAQQRGYGAATSLNDQAVQNATGNTNRQFSADQFNVGTQLQNNQINSVNANANANRQLTADQFNVGTEQQNNQLASSNANADVNRLAANDQFNTATALQNNQLNSANANANANRLNANDQFNVGTTLQNNAQLYGNATNNANRQFSADQLNTGTSLQNNQLASNNETNDLNRQFSAEQFNTNTGFQNNSQQIQAIQQALAGRTQGLGFLSGGNALQDQNYSLLTGAQNERNQYQNDALRQYAGLIGAGAAGTGTSTGTQQQPNTSNPLSGLLGTALGGAQLFSLLSDRRAKTNIKRVGLMDTGLPIYTYNYKAGGPTQMGVMADEAEQIKPEAVIKTGGLDRVNYGAL